MQIVVADVLLISQAAVHAWRMVALKPFHKMLMIDKTVMRSRLKRIASNLSVKLVVFGQVHALIIVHIGFSPEVCLPILNSHRVRLCHIICVSLLISTYLCGVILPI